MIYALDHAEFDKNITFHRTSVDVAGCISGVDTLVSGVSVLLKQQLSVRE
jgi:hypothetical protein